MTFPVVEKKGIKCYNIMIKFLKRGGVMQLLDIKRMAHNILENQNIESSFIERDKKSLIATHKGISLVTIVADTFKSTETTAKWEMELSDIAQGKSSKKNFLEAIETEIKEVVSTYIK